MENPLILGIETSCDETAAAVLRGRAILSNVIASQAEIHREYGGVVPELASRHHLERIDAVVDLALRRARIPLAESDGSLDFSFSGFKTAVLRHAKARGLDRPFPAGEPDQETRDLLASFQSAVVEFMVKRVVTVARRDGARSICLSGGVACNSLLRSRIAEEAEQEGLESYAVSPALACDNAAMIAEVGRRKLLRGETADLTLNADPALEL